MHPDLQAAFDDIAASTNPLSDAQMTWHPPGKWSAAGILEHLMKGFAGTAHIMRRALDQNQPKGRPDTLKARLSAFFVITLRYFPSGRAAPDLTLPAGMSPAEAREQVRRALADLDAVAALCATRFGERTKVANHPVLGALGVRQWRRFHRIHTRHHMKQIERMKGQMT